MNDTENTSAPAAAGEASKPKKGKVSNRLVLGSDRKEAETYIGAHGFRYESVSEPGTVCEVLFRPLAEGAALDTDVVLPDEVILGLAAFGGLTLAGNVTNSIRNGEPKADGPQTEREALEAWVRDLFEGNWTRASGEVEPGMGLLAAAVARTLSDNDGKDRTSAESIAKVKDWLTGLDKETRKKWRSDLRVQRHRAAIQAERAAAHADSAPAATPLPDDPEDV